jgi:hypothetical protein
MRQRNHPANPESDCETLAAGHRDRENCAKVLRAHVQRIREAFMWGAKKADAAQLGSFRKCKELAHA